MSRAYALKTDSKQKSPELKREATASAAHRPQPVRGVLQPRTATTATAPPRAGLAGKTPTAPPVYRPQPAPKCLQLKVAPTSQPLLNTIKRAPLIPPVHPPRPAPKVLQPKLNGARPEAPTVIVQQRHVPATQQGRRQAIVQPFSSRVVQAVKYYPNLHPGAVEPVEPSNVFRLKSFADQYRLNKVNSHGVNVPNQLYNFVRTREGEMLLHNRYRHPSIAGGQQVLYAGEVYFNNGKLEWWSNGSGHYQPDVEDAAQAHLPMDYFYSYQQVIKGEHKRKKS